MCAVQCHALDGKSGDALLPFSLGERRRGWRELASSVEEGKKKAALEDERSGPSAREGPEPKVAYPEPRPSSQYLMTRKGYLHPMTTYVWLTLFVTGLMAALWFVVG